MAGSSYRMEQAIHSFFASKRISGPGTEWFQVSIEVAALTAF
ncbi:MAG: GIY-YIG nuclease family protein [Anderseniella sp.]